MIITVIIILIIMIVIIVRVIVIVIVIVIVLIIAIAATLARLDSPLFLLAVKELSLRCRNMATQWVSSRVSLSWKPFSSGVFPHKVPET